MERRFNPVMSPGLREALVEAIESGGWEDGFRRELLDDVWRYTEWEDVELPSRPGANMHVMYPAYWLGVRHGLFYDMFEGWDGEDDEEGDDPGDPWQRI